MLEWQRLGPFALPFHTLLSWLGCCGVFGHCTSSLQVLTQTMFHCNATAYGADVPSKSHFCVCLCQLFPAHDLSLALLWAVVKRIRHRDQEINLNQTNFDLPTD